MNNNRIQYLDSLRGFAALWVVVVHVAMMPQPNFSLPDWFGIYIKTARWVLSFSL